jgi:hypothetical protein
MTRSTILIFKLDRDEIGTVHFSISFLWTPQEFVYIPDEMLPDFLYY